MCEMLSISRHLPFKLRVTLHKLRRLPFIVERPSLNAMQMCVEWNATHGLGNKIASRIHDARIKRQVSIHTYHVFSPCAPCAREHSRPSLQMGLNWPNFEATHQCTLANYFIKHGLTCGLKIKDYANAFTWNPSYFDIFFSQRE